MFQYLSKFLYILPANKSKLVFLLLIFISVSLLEILGIGMIGPFISLASQPEMITKNNWLNWIYIQLGLENINNFIALIGLFLIVVFCFKSIYNWLVQTYIFKFSYEQRKIIISRLMKGYLQAPYITFLEKNSAQIINNILSLSNQFANSIVSTLLVSFSNLVTLFAISLFLCFVSPIATASLVFIMIPLLLLFNLFKNKMKRWGKELYYSNQGIIRSVNHGLGGFKETRIIGCGEYFEKECSKYSKKYADASIKFYAFKLSPRFIVETILVIVLLSFISISLLLNKNIQELTSTLSMFALASIRLIPAFTNIAGGLSTVRNSSYALDQLYLDLKELEQQPDFSFTNKQLNCQYDEERITFNKKIDLEQVTYRYPKAEKNTLSNISLTLPKGESIALIGKSGAGKTTLVDVILGLLIPQEGDIKIDGKSIYSNLRSWQNLIGYIPQSIFLVDDTIEKNIAFGVPDALIDQEQLNRAIHAAQLSEVVENLPNGIKTRVGERGVMLSGGQRQRVGIARALYHEREILVLDEATSALDNETEHLVTEAIKSLSGSKTIIIIAHRLTTVEHCNCIYLMENGQIVKSGSYIEVVLEESLS